MTKKSEVLPLKEPSSSSRECRTLITYGKNKVIIGKGKRNPRNEEKGREERGEHKVKEKGII